MNEYLDIINFISQHDYLFKGPRNWKRSFLWYKFTFVILRKERVSLRLASWFILQRFLSSDVWTSLKFVPGFLKIKKERINNHCAKIFLRGVFGDLPVNPVKLFNNNFYYLIEEDASFVSKYYSFHSMVCLIKETIIQDQYCAKELIKDGDIVIDAGSHLGDFSALVAYLRPLTKVYAFEPSLKIHALAKKNLEYCPNTRLFTDALGDKMGLTKFMVGNDVDIWGGDAVASSEYLKDRNDQFKESYDVNIITIDNFVKENNLDRVDFIKIDTEGFEKEIIKGASETLKKFSPIIACSAYHLKNDKIDIPKLVLSINPNYKYKLEAREEEDFIFRVD